VYHILPNQGRGIQRPYVTEAQRQYSTNWTNQLYNIYDKRLKRSVQFVSFVTNTTIVHDDFKTTRDCKWLTRRELGPLVRKVPDWQFKMHAIVCELRDMSGLASSPLFYRPNNPMHNLFRLDYRALACTDNNGNFMCNLTNGQPVSHSRWWRSRSAVLAHEMGHLFGLFHTFTGGCLADDLILDTPAESRQTGTFGCPGLLPYDRNRNLFEDRISVNSGGNADTCFGGQKDVCGTTCAACCIPTNPNDERCPEFFPNRESVSEDNLTSPDCCPSNRPVDSCKLRRGVDPLNNVMSYAPDFCMREFTPGQMTSMMAQIRLFKRYIYCNYATVEDRILCLNVPCYSGATSPNCN
jgi:Pregnancy-associated plasma protein-A